MNPQTLRPIVRAPLGDTESQGGGNDSGAAGTIAQAKQTITTTARDTAARIKSAAGETASRAKAEAQRLASEKKEDAAKRIGGYGSALHESAKALEQQDPNIAWATHRIAERIDGLADYVRQSDFNDLRRDLENVARRHPLAFFGGLFVGGLVLGNLLKARADESADSSDENEFEPGNASGSSEPEFDAPEASGI